GLGEGRGHHAAIALQNARLVTDLEEADRLKSEFVSTMSHELRTPLNVIIGYTEMLREEAVGPVNSGQRDLIDRLDARGRELLELIEATLHVGRLEAGPGTGQLGAVRPGDPPPAPRARTPRPPPLPPGPRGRAPPACRACRRCASSGRPRATSASRSSPTARRWRSWSSTS